MTTAATVVAGGAAAGTGRTAAIAAEPPPSSVTSRSQRSPRTTCSYRPRGILDVLDNYAFVRTEGYLPGNDDAYVSLSMVKKFGLRKGDVVTGVIRAAPGRRPQGEVQPAGPPRHRQRRRPGTGARTGPSSRS